MISENRIRSAYRSGIIRLKTDPNMEAGTVAAIGENWFYFGGATAESMSPEEYAKTVPEEDIIREIKEVLDDFRIEDLDEYNYYESILEETCSDIFVSCQITEADDSFWKVEAETAADNRISVVAWIDDITGRVLYNDPRAKTDPFICHIIDQKVRTLMSPLKIEKKSSCIDIHMPSRHGIMIASFEPDVLSGAGYDAIYIGLMPSEDPYVYFDLAAIRSKHDEDILDILTWEDICDEDYTTKTPISGSEIDDLIDACKEP